MEDYQLIFVDSLIVISIKDKTKKVPKPFVKFHNQKLSPLPGVKGVFHDLIFRGTRGRSHLVVFLDSRKKLIRLPNAWVAKKY
ncbi:MAG: hypothetical protein HRT44_04155 [Bdellovibrionales bacterium]|nr:hypothetical protein [Bdellovibrionales bacterium]NQZ18436.1 hypothetical protein [Bdellovibrionales bacterium]